VRLALRREKDARDVVTDPQAPYFGTVLNERSLMPAADARLGRATFESWEQQRPLTESRATPQQSAAR